MAKMFGTFLGWGFNFLYAFLIGLFSAHVDVIRNLFLPRSVIFPTLKDASKKNTSKD